jgi:hypothetical protein
MQNLCICSDQKSKLVTTAEIRGHRMPKRIVAVFYVFSILSRHHLDVEHLNHNVICIYIRILVYYAISRSDDVRVA